MKNSVIPNIDVNVCKNDRCCNMALPNSHDYQSPTYHLGFPALYCKACGSNNYLLNNDDINRLIHVKLDSYHQTVTKNCPHCYSQEKRRYGKTAKGTARWQCTSCHTVFSYKHPYVNQLNKLAALADTLFIYDDFKTLINTLAISDSTFYRLLTQLLFRLTEVTRQLEHSMLPIDTQMHIVTQSMVLPCKNGSPKDEEAKLWGLISSESNSGYILLDSLNYNHLTVSEKSIYSNSEKEETIPPQDRLVDEITLRYERFFKRACTDELNYCSGSVHSKKGYILLPIVTAQIHFYELLYYFPKRTYYHYLEHEVFIRGTCLTAFGKSILDGKSHLFYLAESQNASMNYPYQLQATYSLGWWKNTWYEFYSPVNHSYRYLATLTPKNKLEQAQLSQLPATFYQSKSFIDHFNAVFNKTRLSTLAPNTIQTLFSIFRIYYNYCYLSPQNQTAAQKLSIVNKRYTLSELVMLDIDKESI